MYNISIPLTNFSGDASKDKYFPKDEITRIIETQFALWQAGKLSPTCTPFECYELCKAWNNAFEFEIRHHWQGYQYRLQVAFLDLDFDQELRYLKFLSYL